MICKEAQAVRRAAERPHTFLAWLDEFYDSRHAATYTEAIAPVCVALVSLGVEIEPAQFTETQVSRSKQELLELSGACSAAEFPAKVDAHVSTWEQKRVGELVDSICPLTAA